MTGTARSVAPGGEPNIDLDEARRLGDTDFGRDVLPRIAGQARAYAYDFATNHVPGVQEFEILHEVSPKNDYRFGISMEFADAAAYTGYNEHPEHVQFVQTRWLPEVSDFLEVDYQSREG